jgi:hypothetical protein
MGNAADFARVWPGSDGPPVARGVARRCTLDSRSAQTVTRPSVNCDRGPKCPDTTAKHHASSMKSTDQRLSTMVTSRSLRLNSHTTAAAESASHKPIEIYGPGKHGLTPGIQWQGSSRACNAVARSGSSAGRRSAGPNPNIGANIIRPRHPADPTIPHSASGRGPGCCSTRRFPARTSRIHWRASDETHPRSLDGHQLPLVGDAARYLTQDHNQGFVAMAPLDSDHRGPSYSHPIRSCCGLLERADRPGLTGPCPRHPLPGVTSSPVLPLCDLRSQRTIRGVRWQVLRPARPAL